MAPPQQTLFGCVQLAGHSRPPAGPVRPGSRLSAEGTAGVERHPWLGPRRPRSAACWATLRKSRSKAEGCWCMQAAIRSPPLTKHSGLATMQVSVQQKLNFSEVLVFGSWCELRPPQPSRYTQGWRWTGDHPRTGIPCGSIPANSGSRLFLTSRDRWLACPGGSRLNEWCWAAILCCCVSGSDNHKSDKSHHKRAGSTNLSPRAPRRKCFTWCETLFRKETKLFCRFALI